MSETRLDPVTLSVLASALAGIAEEMGAVLIRGSYSSNIKERRDCSTALFDAEGRMVAQAEHIPVHLGAMPEAVAAIMAPRPRAGRRLRHQRPLLRRHPPAGHNARLPCRRTTVRSSATPSRGPTTPTSAGCAPAPCRPTRARSSRRASSSRPCGWCAAGEYVDDVLDLLLANVRTPDIRRGDLRAQIAANNIAEERVGELIERRGKETVLAAFEEVVSYAERRTREAIRELPDGEHEAEDFMEGDGITDEDIPIRATVDVDGDSMTIDFAGTSERCAATSTARCR